MKINITETKYGNFILAEGDYVCDRINDGEFWDKQLKHYFDKYLNKKSLVVEVGAHCGFHTVYMSRKAGFVLAFEPQTHIYNQLCGNLFLNSCLNVKALNMACYDKTCKLGVSPLHQQEMAKLDFLDKGLIVNYDTCENTGAISLTERGDGNVQAVTIDSMELKQLDFLKVDAQGSDVRVILGARNTIRKFLPVILFEREPKLLTYHNSSFEELFDFLEKELNYEIKKIRVLQQQEGITQEGMMREIYENGDYVAYPPRLKFA